MKRIITRTFLHTLLPVLLFACSFVPVNNQYEKAGTLKKGNFELSGSYTRYNVTNDGQIGESNRNWGLRAGYGVSDKVDLKLRYESLTPSYIFNTPEVVAGKTTDVSYFSFIPKFSLIQEKLSFLLPISYYSYKEENEEKSAHGSLISFTPQLIYTTTDRKNKVDFSLGAKADVYFNHIGVGILTGITAGAGFSTDLSRWAIRPEAAISVVGNGIFFSYGIGAQFILPKKNG